MTREIKKLPFLTILLSIIVLFVGCQQKVNRITGEGLGTYYSILYIGAEDPNLKQSIDSLLDVISHHLSIFDTTSHLYLVNHQQLDTLDDDFVYILQQSLQISEITAGAFDPTIEPLVEYWGFGKNKQIEAYNMTIIDSLKALVGYQKVSLDGKHLIKENPNIQLNFNAIAKGYTVDKVAELIAAKGYPNGLVEIGGEVTAIGNKNGKPWVVGIQVPTTERDGSLNAQYLFALQGKAIATSGNYRNYKEENGQRYSHIIDPKSGLPEKSSLLSVSVIADNCMTADAYATAFMVMGIEKSTQFLKKHPELAAYFIFGENGEFNSFSTENFPKKR
ncbi:MAG: FAD:protein FMN transferase [Bacteroidales bacterium]|jgi:thiamine biosynthesis lipoprotein|nr:FAD:protein FMN transferase [Bacteroidales bacterium]